MAEIAEAQMEPVGNGQIVEGLPDTEISEAVVEITKLRGIIAEAQAQLAEITNAKMQALAAATKIEDHQTVIATKSAHIQGALEHADKVRDDLDKQLIAATQHATDAEGQKTRSQTAATDVAELLADTRTTVGAVEADATAVKAALASSKESAELSKELADKAETTQSTIVEYENRLAGFEKECAARLKTIEGLLPGATSAGLAHSFDERRKTFLKPHNLWQFVFVGSVLSTVLVALTGFLYLYKLETIPTFEEIVRMWLARVPFAAPFIYLAYYASRESGLAKRLEEEYGYKSALSSSFEGFRKQMSEIADNVPQEHPLTKLCTNMLAAMANPPGRIYEKHKPGVTPGEALKDTIGFPDK